MNHRLSEIPETVEVKVKDSMESYFYLKHLKEMIDMIG